MFYNLFLERHYIFVVLCLLFTFNIFAFEITPEEGNDMIFLDISYETQANVEGVVDGRVIDDSDTLRAFNLYLDKTFLITSTDNSKLKVSYSLYDMQYDTFSENDFRLHSPSSTWRWFQTSNITHDFKLGYELAELDSDKLYDGFVFTYNATFKNTDYGKRKFIYQLNTFDYGIDFNNDRNGLRNRFEAKWYLTKRTYPLTLSTRFENRTADDDGFAYNGIEGLGQIEFTLFDNLIDCNARVGLRFRKFNDDYPDFTKTRSDKKISLSSSGEYTFQDDRMSLSSEILYEKNSSNIDDFDLKNISISMHFTLLFD